MTILRICAVLAAGAGTLAAADWPGFRGAQANAVAEGELPVHWSATENVVWKADIPGIGWSSPVVWGDRIFLTSVIPSGAEEAPKKGLYFGGERKPPADEHRWTVFCVDFKTGKILWQKEVFHGVPKQGHHLKNTYASETAVTDGDMVYFYFGNTGLYAFDMNGNAKWSRAYDPQNTRYGWGTAASPILYKGRLYIVNDNDEHSYIDVLDKKTGAVIAKIDRTGEGTNWATPFIWENEKRTELIVNGTKHVRSYDLDGKLLWEFSGMSSIAIPTPFSKFGLLYLSSGYVGDQVRPAYAIRPGASGDISLKTGETSSAYVAWYLPQAGAYNPTPVIYGDYFYTLLDRGFLTCHDARTGKEVYAKVRIDPAVGEFTASPIAANGKLYLFSEGGDGFVVEAGAEYKLIAKNSLDEMTMATPAAIRGNLIVRTASHLYRIGK